MYSYNQFILKNGLRVIHLEDKTRTTIVLNTLYNVGARDENQNRTGFAHLFEHLMFSGSKNVAIFDKEVEEAGGQNNAFTNNEITNYYLVMPNENAETAFWLESDRMLALNINEKSLSVQQGVVVEEFKQRCFNAPFGLLWHHVRSLVYKESPYRWPTIGLNFHHVEEAKIEDVQAFYDTYYCPQNAIVSVVGDISLDETKALSDKWFGGIVKDALPNTNQYIDEPVQTERRFLEAEDLSPNPAVFLVWRGPFFNDPKSLHLEMFSEVLGGSDVSPLQMELVKNKKLFNSSECFYLRGLGEGLFLLYGILNPNVSHAEGEQALLEIIQTVLIPTDDISFAFEGVKNRHVTNLLFEATQPMQLAQKLCYYANAGDIEQINKEPNTIEGLTLQEVMTTASATLKENTVSVIYYHPKK
ncbi:MAG: insulinase family protein [Bacteroidetes bacterium]|nr:insulinase family protein [Bacteroidota bacterium]